MATVKVIDHDSSTTIGDFYSTVTDPDGAITVTPAAALGGSTNGVNMDNDAGANPVILAESFTAISGNELRFRARISIDSITSFSASGSISNIRLRDSASIDVFRVIINANAGGTGAVITLFVSTDIGITVLGANTPLPTGDTCFEIKAIRETADGNNDGIAEFYVGNSLIDSSTTLQNFNDWVANGGMQEVEVSFSTLHTGDFHYDEFIVDDNASTSLGCSELLTLSIMPSKVASIDASGTFIYLALLNGGTPILFKISTALTADGLTVFNPGAGDTVGVECGRFDADVIWIAGLFSGTDQVEKSEDAGSTFVVKNVGFNAGGVFAFDVGPDSDTKVIVNNNDTQTLETVDDGAIWTVITTTNIETLSIDRLGRNTQETVFGNFGDVNNSINYSVNSGADIEDFQTGVFPNENVTGVIVN